MNVKLRRLQDLEEAMALEPLLDRAARESSAASSESAPADGAMLRFLGRHLERPETLVLVAEAEGADDAAGVCVTGPLEDPLSGEVTPLVVALWVQPGLRHRGLARALVREVRRILAARELPGLAARVGHNDDALISMGERWGFTRRWEMMVAESS
jgi:ribosomal protein S18 acetylase RimI-like enzyme